MDVVTVASDGRNFIVVYNSKGKSHSLKTARARFVHDHDPSIRLSGLVVRYPAGSNPIVIDSAASVADPDSENFEGGLLTVDFMPVGGPDDQLGIRNQGVVAGAISVAGDGRWRVGRIHPASGTIRCQRNSVRRTSPDTKCYVWARFCPANQRNARCAVCFD